MGNTNYITKDTSFDIPCIMVPKEIFEDEHYQQMSVSAKMLYTLLLGRLAEVQQNNQHTEVSVCYSRKEAMEALNCAKNTVSKAFKELREFGLIEEITRGQKENMIFVKKPVGFTDNK